MGDDLLFLACLFWHAHSYRLLASPPPKGQLQSMAEWAGKAGTTGAIVPKAGRVCVICRRTPRITTARLLPRCGQRRENHSTARVLPPLPPPRSETRPFCGHGQSLTTIPLRYAGSAPFSQRAAVAASGRAADRILDTSRLVAQVPCSRRYRGSGANSADRWARNIHDALRLRSAGGERGGGKHPRLETVPGARVLSPSIGNAWKS